MDVPLDTWEVLLLVVISLVGGIGISAIGPGGILVTIALFLLTDLSPAQIAGTAIVTHIGTGIVGSFVYIRSGQLREPQTRRLAVILGVTALLGTPIGAILNGRMSGEVFGILLAMLVMLVGVSVLLRERRLAHRSSGGQTHFRSTHSQGVLGAGIALASGIFGIGGPMLSVPILVMGGAPILTSLAAAQAQSIVVAAVGTVAYFGQGAISWSLVFLTGVPQIIGVWLGWRVAHALPRRPLTYTLAVSLIALGPIIAFLRLAS